MARSFDPVGAHGTGFLALVRRRLVSGIKSRPCRVECEPRGVGVIGEDLAEGQFAACRIHGEKVNPATAALASLRALRRTVAAHIGEHWRHSGKFKVLRGGGQYRASGGKRISGEEPSS